MTLDEGVWGPMVRDVETLTDSRSGIKRGTFETTLSCLSCKTLGHRSSYSLPEQFLSTLVKQKDLVTGQKTFRGLVETDVLYGSFGRPPGGPSRHVPTYSVS